jgi:ABC-type antimicrobial peptide transport system permease subunit
VENTFLSTFQMLGGLGLLLGTAGLGAVLLRNVFERRRELSLLRALGYKQSDFFTLVMAENLLLLVGGLLTGAACAVLAIVPALIDHGGSVAIGSIVILLGGVLAAGLVTSFAATTAALRSGILSGIRSE